MDKAPATSTAPRRQEGAYNLGTVFQVDAVPAAAGPTTDLHDFTVAADGSHSGKAALLVDSSGNVYGTTYAGGQTGSRCDSAVSYQMWRAV